MNFRGLALVPLAAVSIGMAAPAAAQTTFNYDFGTLFTGGGPSSATFAHLSVTTSDYLSFVYHLTVGDNLNAVFGSTGTFVSSLRVNTASNADPNSVAISPGTWGVAEVRLNSDPNNAGSVDWDFMDSFCGSGNGCNPNNGSSRLTQGEEVEWTTTFTSVQNPPFGEPPFLLKVQGYGDSAAYVAATPIPEPEAYAMLLAGLGLLGLAMRRRRERAAA
jgi:hypothetical protein